MQNQHGELQASAATLSPELLSTNNTLSSHLLPQSHLEEHVSGSGCSGEVGRVTT